jgi:parafibromin
MDNSSALDRLREACTTGALSTHSSLSDDGKVLTLYGSTYDATIPHTLILTTSTGEDKIREVSYTLASLYLQLLYPVLLGYRKACSTSGVKDPVKILDKDHVISYFVNSSSTAAAVGEDVVETAAMEKEDVVMPGASDNDDDDDDDAAIKKKAKIPKTVKRPSSRDRGESSNKKRIRDAPSEHTPSTTNKKSSSGPITNEMLVANLGKIVDKRYAISEAKEGGDVDMADATDNNDPSSSQETVPGSQETTATTDDQGGLSQSSSHGGTSELVTAEGKEDRELLLSWLSPEGFRVDSPTVAAAIEADREAVRQITASEIPVGDSASILRAGAGGEVGGVKKDFARVLEIFQEVVANEERTKRGGGATPSSSSKEKRRPPPPATTPSSSSKVLIPLKSLAMGNPIIVVPNAMTSVITMINAGFFFGKEGVFLTREQASSNPAAGKRGGTITISRKLAPRLGGAEITYDIIDNPATRLKKDEWNRVVAVICQGASWQFKGWRYSDPVDLFSRTFGFYVGLEGAAVPNELQGWNVKTGKISRDRRGLDNVCLASFWNGLEEFMAVHKQGYIAK